MRMLSSHNKKPRERYAVLNGLQRRAGFHSALHAPFCNFRRSHPGGNIKTALALVILAVVPAMPREAVPVGARSE
jgi:hypothetical protein